MILILLLVRLLMNHGLRAFRERLIAGASGTLGRGREVLLQPYALGAAEQLWDFGCLVWVRNVATNL